MAAAQRDLPIFFDASRRRWKRLKLWSVIILLTLVSLASIEAYRVSSLEDIQNSPDNTVNVQQLADLLYRENVPVIGNGPLAHVLKVEGHTVREIYSTKPSRRLSDEERQLIGDYGYVIERYGATGNNRRLVLTFDDGPDKTYTPQLLDLLSKESVPATFFIVGRNIVQHQDLVRREVREGHEVANHSFTHADFETVSSTASEQEINLTRRTIRAVSGYGTTFIRPPYIGVDDQSLRNGIHGILQSQRLGLTVALYDFDTNDWQHHSGDTSIPLPPLDGRDQVLLLHDGGGDRGATIAYVQRLITEAKRQGYQFTTMHGLYPAEKAYFARQVPTPEDDVTVTVAEAATTWPLRITWGLFLFSILFVFVGLIVYVILAIIEVRRTRRFEVLEKNVYKPSVTVIVPAFNEAKVLEGCVRALRSSNYRKLKVIIVDDGSTDNTWAIAQRLAVHYGNVEAYTQPNAGKSAAINHAVRKTRSPVIISIDADTVFRPDTVSRLVRHFEDPRVGAVAGMVHIGNRKNLLTRCQALEYSTSISLERTAQAYLDAIMVVPGACGAWRRQAIVAAGRYTSMTLAEDCDLTVGVHAAGYKIVQDNTAIAYTEAPMTLRSFARQRFRWSFGNIQVYWKYRRLFYRGRRTWLNSFVLPLAAVSTISPVIFMPLLLWIMVQNVLAGQYKMVIIFMILSTLFQFTRAFVALRLGKHDMRHLWYVPIARLLYGPIRIYLLYGTFLRAFRGDAVGWNKLSRVGMELASSRQLARQKART